MARESQGCIVRLLFDVEFSVLHLGCIYFPFTKAVLLSVYIFKTKRNLSRRVRMDSYLNIKECIDVWHFLLQFAIEISVVGIYYLLKKILSMASFSVIYATLP